MSSSGVSRWSVIQVRVLVGGGGGRKEGREERRGSSGGHDCRCRLRLAGERTGRRDDFPTSSARLDLTFLGGERKMDTRRAEERDLLGRRVARSPWVGRPPCGWHREEAAAGNRFGFLSRRLREKMRDHESPTARTTPPSLATLWWCYVNLDRAEGLEWAGVIRRVVVGV